MATQLFSMLPVIGYTFDENYYLPDNNFNIVHLLKRYNINELLIDRTVKDFYTYKIDDGDTPELVAYKLYGNPYYFYIILMFNNIMDVYTQWAKKESSIYDYCIEKYGEANVSATHHFENGTGKIVQDKYYNKADKIRVTNYDYEVRENDKKKIIKVISPDLIIEITDKLTELTKNG